MKHTKEQVESKIESLRRQYKKGLLTQEQIQQLKSIKGWTWVDAQHHN